MTTLSAIECCVGILSACLPTYRPLWRKYGWTRTKQLAVADKSDSGDLEWLNRAAGSIPLGERTPQSVAIEEVKGPMLSHPLAGWVLVSLAFPHQNIYLGIASI